MKLAITGKGGAGKTALSTMLVLALRAEGRPVLAVDLDTNPGLAVSLGIEPADVPLPDEAVQERPGTPYGWGLRQGLDPDEAARRFATPVIDGVTFLGLGNITHVEKPVRRYLTAVLEMATGFDDTGTAVVADLEAGPTTPFEGYPRFASPWIVVSEATPASMLAARRILSIAAHEGVPTLIVANKVRAAGDLERLERDLAPVDVAVPFDPEVRGREAIGPLVGIERSATSTAWPAAQALARRVLSIDQGVMSG